MEGEGRRWRRRRRESERGREAAWSWLESRASEGRAAVADSCRLLTDPARIALSGYRKLAFTPPVCICVALQDMKRPCEIPERE